MSSDRSRTPQEPDYGPAPEVLFAITLVASVVIWIPSLLAVMGGQLTLTTSILRYVIGLVFCWVAIHAVSLLLRSYAKANTPSEPPAESRPTRRASDRYPGENAETALTNIANPTLGDVVDEHDDLEFESGDPNAVGRAQAIANENRPLP